MGEATEGTMYPGPLVGLEHETTANQSADFLKIGRDEL
jgi:hypothetical protein